MTGSSSIFFESIDRQCGTTHNMTALSAFTCTTASVLMLLTIPLNSVIIYSLIKERKKKYKTLFYKLLFNIAMADLLTGLIADSALFSSIFKEALLIEVSVVDIYISHLSLFFTDAVALLTLTLLSIERFLALVSPIGHYGDIKKRTENLLMLSAWLFAMFLVLPYFQLKFIRQLLIFSSINIAITVVALIVTTVTYKQKLSRPIRIKQRCTNPNNVDPVSSINEDAPPETVRKPNRLLSNTRKVTRTFIIMLVQNATVLSCM